MSSSQKILDITKAMATQLCDSINGDPKTKNLAVSIEQITFSPPKGVKSSSKISIFPYSFIHNQINRNPSAPTSGSFKQIVQTFSVRYLIIPTTGNAENDLLLLEKIILTFQAKPILSDEATKTGNPVALTPDALSLSDLTNLWSAINEPLKPCVSYSASPILLGTGEQQSMQDVIPSVDRSQIMQLYQTVFKTFTEQSDSWKHRNMLQKQYVIMDFSKNTDMSPEEMISKLKDLGQQLETNQDIDQSVETLKKLQAYYEHQKDMLKGFEKIQKKRQEGIDMVTKWRTDVAALIEALCNNK